MKWLLSYAVWTRAGGEHWMFGNVTMEGATAVDAWLAFRALSEVLDPDDRSQDGNRIYADAVLVNAWELTPRQAAACERRGL